MGCYDDIELKCPECGEARWVQSKGGDCCMMVYTLDDCPLDVLSDANRHAPYECEKCHIMFAVDEESRTTYTHLKKGPHPDSFEAHGGFGIELPDGRKL
jgi:transposase-like protein